jgi:hypothetical protein
MSRLGEAALVKRAFGGAGGPAEAPEGNRGCGGDPAGGGGGMSVTPPVLTGGGVERISIHWMDVTVRGGPEAVMDVMGETVGLGRGMFRDCGVSRFWGRSWRATGLFVGADNRGGGKADTVLLSIAGEAWELYGEEKLLQAVRRLWRSLRAVTRVDVAFDGVRLSPGDFYLAWVRGEWDSRAGVNFWDSARGKTLWVGKLLAGCSQVCVYDERGDNRLEFRTRRREWAKAVVEAALRGKGETLGRVTKRGVRAFVGGAWGPLDAWIGSVDPLERAVGSGKDGREANDDDFKAISGRVAVWIIRHGWEEFYEQAAWAGKGLDGATLRKYAISREAVTDVLGRIGPEGYQAPGRGERVQGDG